jgi:hypothetical protein
MLNYRLDFPVKKYMHPIFYSVAGIVSTLVAIFKIWEKHADASFNGSFLQGFGSSEIEVRVSDLKRHLAF